MFAKFIAVAATLAAGLTFLGFQASAEDLVESGTFNVEVLRVSFIGSAARGKGVLHYKGKDYKGTGKRKRQERCDKTLRRRNIYISGDSYLKGQSTGLGVVTRAGAVANPHCFDTQPFNAL